MIQSKYIIKLRSKQRMIKAENDSIRNKIVNKFTGKQLPD